MNNFESFRGHFVITEIKTRRARWPRRAEIMVTFVLGQNFNIIHITHSAAISLGKGLNVLYLVFLDFKSRFCVCARITFLIR